MARYECSVCGFVYDEKTEGKKWASLPGDWVCPVCGAVKSKFRPRSETKDVQETPTAHSQPNRALFAHRVFGYVFLLIYVVLMWQMVPRLWTYQIEFPARTAIHISLGMAIGAILILKIVIVRFFRRLDASFVPMLGTSLLVGTVVLIGMSVPSAFAEGVATGRLFTGENRDRVHMLLTEMGLPADQCDLLSSPESLRAGQQVLRQQCVVCHDLRTVLAKPRTPENWRQTVRRMADRTTLLNPLDEDAQLQVTAYLVALSPQLQRSTKQMRQQRDTAAEAKQAAKSVEAQGPPAAAYDAAKAKQLFETKCSQCHDSNLVKSFPLSSEKQARDLVALMVEEGLSVTKNELAHIVKYLADTYGQAKK